MTQVVFTGTAVLADGRKLIRASLIKAANKAGIAVLSTWNRNCDYLIASRNDTVKARGAMQEGKQVFTYDQFVRHLDDLGVDAFDAEFVGEANPYVDKVHGVSATPVAEVEAGAVVL